MLNTRLILLVFFTLSCLQGFGDDPRYQTDFWSADSAFNFHLEKEGIWTLQSKSGKVLYQIPDQGFTGMAVFISSNGENIVVLDDWAYGHEFDERTALWLFAQGKLLQSYPLAKLIAPKFITFSVSHMKWIVDRPALDEGYDSFSFATNDFFEYSFALSTGEMLYKKRPSWITEGTAIVFGEFVKESNEPEQVEMKIICYITDSTIPSNTISFETSRYGAGKWRQVIAVRDGKDITPKKYRNKVLLNNCVEE